MIEYDPIQAFSSPTSQVNRFLSLLLASGLMRFSAVQETCASFDTDRTDLNALDELSDLLTASGQLTGWQCEKLRSGKWKGFYLDRFCFLDQLSVSETTTTMLAKDMVSGSKVAITITPPNLKDYEISEVSQ